MIAAAELAIYRLAVPALRPTGPDSPPLWHEALGYLGLFLFYFATALAFVVVVRQIVLFARGDHPYWKPIGHALVVAGAGFIVYVVKSLVAVPSERDTFLFESGFAAVLFLLSLGQLRRGGDSAVKLGLLFLAVPLLVHVYRDAAVRWFFGPEALWEGVADRVDAYGQWSMVLAALLTPYCFAPRPFNESAGRLAPLAIGAFVGVVGALVMRQSYEVGYLLAKRGLGVDLGAGAPTSQIALYLIALGSLTWTLVSCFMAPAPARRRIGVGLGLVVASGYGFSWPLQYLAGLVGLLTIGEAARTVAEQESSALRFATARFRSPAIPDEPWRAYVADLVAALRARGHHASAVSVEGQPAPGQEAVVAAVATAATAAPPAEAPAAPKVPADARIVTTAAERPGVSRTHVLVLEAATAPVRLLIERINGSIRALEIVCGGDWREVDRPVWTMEARGERRLGPAHPPAPPVRARALRTGDPEFDRRFRVRDAGSHTAGLLDEGLRARATALLDGWLAFWPGRSLVYHLVPGRGAPLDSPIPITQLAFSGNGAVDRLVTLIELVAEIAERGLGAQWKAPPRTASDALDDLPPAPEGAVYGDGEGSGEGGSGEGSGA